MFSLPEGIRHLPHYLSVEQQALLLDEIRKVVAAAPLFTPEMPRTGQPMTVRMSNCGPLGWVSDKQKGYRYQQFHPDTSTRWPPMPAMLLDLWHELTGLAFEPEACLVNYYTDSARMGLHQDRDEAELSAPVLSISLGNSCLFRIGGPDRKDKTQSFRLDSGDIVLIGGPSRLNFHGVNRMHPGTSTLLKQGGRINLTLRRVTPVTGG